MALNEEQKTQFFQDGYIVIKELLTTDELETLRKHYANLVLGRVPDFPEGHISHYTPSAAQTVEPPTPHGSQHNRSGTQVYPKGEATDREQARTPIDDPLDTVGHLKMPSYYDSVFKGFVRSPKFVDIIESLMGPNIKLYYDQVFAKPPYAKANRYHQDSVFWSFFASNFQVTCQVLLDDATVENGCVRFIPGSHNFGLVNWDHLPYMLTEEVLAQEVAVPLKAGDATLHHSLALHCSGPNTTPYRRRGWSIHYVSAATRYIGTPKETEHLKQLGCLVGPEPVNGWPLIRGREFPGCV